MQLTSSTDRSDYGYVIHFVGSHDTHASERGSNEHGMHMQSNMTIL